MRNLWDFHSLSSEFTAADAGFWGRLDERAAMHGLGKTVHRAARLARDLYGTKLPSGWNRIKPDDERYKRRLLARDDWGRATDPLDWLGHYAPRSGVPQSNEPVRRGES